MKMECESTIENVQNKANSIPLKVFPKTAFYNIHHHVGSRRKAKLAGIKEQSHCFSLKL